MKKARINRDILSIAIPAIVANITTPLLGIIDTAIVGHMGNSVFLAAVALGNTMFSMLYWVFSFLRMGTSGMTAQAYGANNQTERDASLYRALAIAIMIGICMIILQLPIRNLMLHFFGSEDSTRLYASLYFDILIYGAPATLALYAVNGWMIGVQNSRLLMWTSLIVNCVNILASLLLVYVAHLGIKGVATGTLIAQWAGLISGLLLISNYKPKLLNLKILFNSEACKHFFTINRDIFLRTLCLVTVTVWFTRAGARQSNIILAVNALLMQLFILFSYLMDGFAYAGEALVGKFTGSKNLTEKRSVIQNIFVIGTIVSLSFTLVYGLAGEEILSLLSNDESVITIAKEYRWWAVTIPFAGVSAFIWDGIYVGETRTRGMLISMASAMIIFFSIYFLLFSIMGNHALWLAFILYLATRGIIQTLLYTK